MDFSKLTAFWTGGGRRFNFLTRKTLNFFKPSKKKDALPFKDTVKLVLSKISGAFMLPISVMAIGGLFLGVGASIASNGEKIVELKIFGNFIKALGDGVFYALPLLFAVAFVIAFTEEAGVAVFATIIGYVVFSLIQSVFIQEHSVEILKKITYGNGTGSEFFAETDKRITGYTVLFEGAGRSPASLQNVVGNVLGINVLNTSVFGGLIVGLVMSKLYNKFYNIQLPTLISFFGGKRFVALIGIVSMIPLAFLFLILWPWVGVGLNKFGSDTGKVPYGFESFIFGYIERALIPFGLHHAFYAPLWYTGVGGDFKTGLQDFYKNIEAAGNKSAGEWNQVIEWTGQTKDFMTAMLNDNVKYPAAKWQGDSTISSSLLALPFNNVEWKWKTDVTFNGIARTKDSTASLPILQFTSDYLNIKIGRYTQGKYPFMQFGLPAAAAAMILAAPKENRKLAISAVAPAAATSFVTGVTEPIEFTFLFLSPFLFWGFHAFMCALSFMLMNVTGAHIGQAFSGGVLDLLSYGILPFQKGTRFWLWAVIGIVYVPIYFFFFLFWIKHKNLATPGRQGSTKLFTKKDWIKRSDDPKTTTNEQPKEPNQQIKMIVDGMGGFVNLTKINNCASRLRLDVVDRTKVDEAKLRSAGAFGVRWIGEKHCQVIVGPKAEQLAANIRKLRRSGLA